METFSSQLLDNHKHLIHKVQTYFEKIQSWKKNTTPLDFKYLRSKEFYAIQLEIRQASLELYESMLQEITLIRQGMESAELSTEHRNRNGATHVLTRLKSFGRDILEESSLDTFLERDSELKLKMKHDTDDRVDEYIQAHQESRLVQIHDRHVRMLGALEKTTYLAYECLKQNEKIVDTFISRFGTSLTGKSYIS